MYSIWLLEYCHVPTQPIGSVLSGQHNAGFRELSFTYIAKRYQLDYLNPEGKVEVNETDGIHYTEKGHAQMAELMAEKVKEILR